MPSTTLIRYLYPNISGWPCPLGSHEVITQRVSPAIFKIMGTRHIGVTTFTFLGYVTSSVTWPFDSSGAICYRCSIVTESLSPVIFRDNGPQWGHDLDLSRSRGIIRHVINRSTTYHFLLVSYWNLTAIFNRFRDICSQIYLGHGIDISKSRDVIGHVTNWFPMCHFL